MQNTAQTTPPIEKPIRTVIGIIGDYCSGKQSCLEYLSKTYNYEIYDYRDLYAKETSSDSTMLSILNSSSFTSPLVKAWVNDMSKIKIAISNIVSVAEIAHLKSKASFNLIYISTPTKHRFANYLKKTKTDLPTFETFLEEDYWYSSNENFHKIKAKADYIIINNTSSWDSLYLKLDKLINQLDNFRPNWDDYFMAVAHEVEQRCNCVKSKVGAVIVKDKRIVSVGYNGTSSKLPNCYKGQCERCWSNAKSGVDWDKCICIHAEENAWLEAGRNKCVGSIIYCTVYPCWTCTKHIIQCGIEEVVYDIDYNSELTKSMFVQAGIKVKKWMKQIEQVI